MEDLISLSETMQKASALLTGGDNDEASPTTYLQVLVLGNLGAGKSATLNTLIGHPVLPTADGGATRFPLVVDLQQDQHVADGGVRGKLGSKTNMQSSSEIRRAVQADMKRWLPTSSRNKEESHLTIRSASAPPLRLVDLPGLEARQSEHDNMILDHAANRDSFVLVVVPATSVQDLSASRVLRVSQDVDQEGTRTVGVITKVDQISEDKAGIAAVIELLSGRGPSVTRDFPWVALIGQPTADTGDSVSDSLEQEWKREIDTIGNILRSAGGKGLEASLGRSGLVKVLARQMRKRMKDKIPRILAGLEERQAEVDVELLRLGDNLLSTAEGGRALALELCRGFDTKFIDNIEGGGEGGGAKMVEKFVGALPSRFKNLPLDNLFGIVNVKKVVLEADGYQPYLLSPEKGLKLLVKRTLDLAKQPGLHVVDEVHKILLDIISAAGNTTPSLVRFPPLKRQLVAIASAIVDDYRTEARKMVNALVDMERVFIPPAHFIDAANRRAERLRREEEAHRKREQDKIQAQRRTTPSSDAGSAPAASDDPKQPSRMSAALNSLRGKKDAPPAEPLKELAGFLWKVSSKNGWSKRWFALSDKTCRLYYVKKPDEKAPRGVIPLEECVLEDVVAQEEFPPIPNSGDPLRGAQPQNAQSAQSLVFKLTNKVPYKTVVKVHHSLILRAENMAEKAQWVQRIRLLTKPQDPTPPPPEAAEKDAGPVESPPTSVSKPEEPSAAALGPIARRAPADPDEDLKSMALEVRKYVEHVLTNLSQNIPKAVVLTQVERAKEQMLTKLYTSISALPNNAIEELLVEDPESKSKRESFNKKQEDLAKLRRSLSLHEARASAEDANAAVASVKDNPMTEDWRSAFQQAGSGTPIPDEPAIVPQQEQPVENGVPTSSRRSSRGSTGGSSSSRREAPTPAAAPAPTPATSAAESMPRTTSNGSSSGFFRQSSSAPPPPASNGPPAEAPPPSMGPPMGRRPGRLPPPPPPGGGMVYRY